MIGICQHANAVACVCFCLFFVWPNGSLTKSESAKAHPNAYTFEKPLAGAQFLGRGRRRLLPADARGLKNLGRPVPKQSTMWLLSRITYVGARPRLAPSSQRRSHVTEYVGRSLTALEPKQPNGLLSHTRAWGFQGASKGGATATPPRPLLALHVVTQ